MSFPDIAISLRSSRIKATPLARGISCGNEGPCPRARGATYYGPFRASRGANRGFHQFSSGAPELLELSS